jgi:hypothetical protein
MFGYWFPKNCNVVPLHVSGHVPLQLGGRWWHKWVVILINWRATSLL